MDLLKKMESVQARAEQVDLKAEQRNEELNAQLKNLESTVDIIQQLNSRLVGSLSKFSDKFTHVVTTIDKIESHLERKIDDISAALEQNSKYDRTLTERVSGFEERQHSVETKLQQLEKMFSEDSELVRREELHSTLQDRRGEMVSSQELGRLSEQVAGITSQLQTITEDQVRRQELSSTEEQFRAELEQCRAELRDGLAGAAPAGDLSELGKQLTEQLAQSAARLDSLGDSVKPYQLTATVEQLRGELEQTRNELRETAGQAAGGELVLLGQRVAGIEAGLEQLGAVAQSDQLEATAQQLRGELEQSRVELREGLEHAAPAGDLSELDKRVAAQHEQLQARLDSLGDTVKPFQLSATVDQLRGELEALRGELRDGLEAASAGQPRELLEPRLAAVEQRLEASGSTVQDDQLEAIAAQLRGELEQTRGELEQTRGELEQTRGELREGLASAAPAGDLSELDKQLAEHLAQLEARLESMGDSVKPFQLEARLEGITAAQPDQLEAIAARLRDELHQLREELRRGLAQAALAGDVDRLGQRLAGIESQREETSAADSDGAQLDQRLAGMEARLDDAAGIAAQQQQAHAAMEQLDARLQEATEGVIKQDDLVTAMEQLRGEQAHSVGELRVELERTRSELAEGAGAAAAEDLDALREELAHAVTDIEAVKQATPPTDAEPSVSPAQLDQTAQQLRQELNQLKTELSGDLAAADDLFALREQLASHAAELETTSSDSVKQEVLGAAVDGLEQKLRDLHQELTDSFSGGPSAEDLDALRQQLRGATDEFQTVKQAVTREDMESALNDLRFEFSSITDDLRHSVAGAASADDLDAIKQRLAGSTAEFKTVKLAVKPEQLEAALSELRDEVMAAQEGVRKALAMAATTSQVEALRDELATSHDATTRDDISTTAAMLREDLTLANEQLARDVQALSKRLELAQNDIEFVKSAQTEMGPGSMDKIRIELAAVQAALQDAAPEGEHDLETLRKQFSGLAMDVSSTEAELKKRLDEVTQKLAAREGTAGAEGVEDAGGGATEGGELKHEVDRIVAGYARKSEVNTAIKETNAAFRKIVQDFDQKHVELRGQVTSEVETRLQKLGDRTEDVMSRIQHMINDFQQRMEGHLGLNQEVKDLKQQMILTQNAIMELNQFVEDLQKAK